MIKSLLSSILLFLTCAAHAQSLNDSIAHSLYFIGDAGEAFIVNSKLGDVLYHDIKTTGTKSTVLFLGDNIYPKGMPDADHKERLLSEKILRTQATWIKELNANVIFIPGNHDWMKGRKQGWEQLTNQQQWIDSLN